MVGDSLLVMNIPPLHLAVIYISLLELRQLVLSMTSGDINTVCTIAAINTDMNECELSCFLALFPGSPSPFLASLILRACKCT